MSPLSRLSLFGPRPVSALQSRGRAVAAKQLGSSENIRHTPDRRIGLFAGYQLPRASETKWREGKSNALIDSERPRPTSRSGKWSS